MIEFEVESRKCLVGCPVGNAAHFFRRKKTAGAAEHLHTRTSDPTIPHDKHTSHYTLSLYASLSCSSLAAHFLPLTMKPDSKSILYTAYFILFT